MRTMEPGTIWIKYWLKMQSTFFFEIRSFVRCIIWISKCCGRYKSTLCSHGRSTIEPLWFVVWIHTPIMIIHSGFTTGNNRGAHSKVHFSSGRKVVWRIDICMGPYIFHGILYLAILPWFHLATSRSWFIQSPCQCCQHSHDNRWRYWRISLLMTICSSNTWCDKTRIRKPSR